MKKCKYCQTEIDEKAKVCPNCRKDLRSFFGQHKLFTGIVLLIIFSTLYTTTILNNSDFTADNTVQTSMTTQKQEKKYVNIGENIQTKDWEVKITEVKFGQRINPPTQPMFYQYYQVKDTDNTYLCVILECKNISSLELGADSVATIKAKYNNKYTYSSFSAVEDSNLGFTYSEITNIDPLTSKKVYYLAEMPKIIENEEGTPVELEIKIDNNSYYYKVR